MPLFDDNPAQRSVPVHQCRESTVCKCSMIGDEPAEHCPVHGCGDYPPRCAECGKYIPAIPLNSTVAEWDTQRLSVQHHAILSRLREGPATGPELATIAIRYSARLQEMKALHPWLKRAIGGGQYEYRLVEVAAGENP